MFAFIFRGVFLIGIISWYSTSVWKMIDVYFKNRFESYLRSEYDKNPHMLADIEAYRTAAGKESPAETGAGPIPEEGERGEKEVAAATAVPLNDVLKACSADVCLVSDNIKKGETPGLVELIPTNAETTLSDSIDPVKPEIKTTTESPERVDGNEIIKLDDKSHPEASSKLLRNDSAKRGNADRKKKTKRVIASGNKVEGGKAAKKKLKTITLTEKDFKSTRIEVTPQDFAEFDLDEDAIQDREDESQSMILVSDLPFKPKADIGDLRQISPDEFCPLTLDEEFSCDETKTWPA